MLRSDVSPVISRALFLAAAFCLLALVAGPSTARAETTQAETTPAETSQVADAERLVAAMLADTPVEENLHDLTDSIGGRPTGSKANEAAVQWALDRFREAGVDARAEAFEMPAAWREVSARATLGSVDGRVSFSPRVTALAFSGATPAAGLRAPLLDVGQGSEADFEQVADRIAGAYVLASTDPLLDVPGLFAEYIEFGAVQSRAEAAGAAGVVFISSRPANNLFRHLAPSGPGTKTPLIVVERDAGTRAARLLRSGTDLDLDLRIDIESGGPFTAHNVIGEIRGSESPEEILVLGAHLDSWGLGTGALDNGSNVCLLIDVARQIQRLGLQPRRTIRFALWNGEEQGLFGSWAYVEQHEDELDRHVAAASLDIGTGRLEGLYTNGRGDDVSAVLERALATVAGLGPFTHPDAPIYGTDHFDFLIQGVVGLVGNQASANYGPHYHSRSDTFDKADLHQLKLNSAIVAAIAWGFANDEVTWGRMNAAEIEEMVETSLKGQMQSFGAWESWAAGKRGRRVD